MMSEDFSIEAKKAAILASLLPDAQKQEYLSRLSPETHVANKISFDVYVRIRKIPKYLHAGMLASPKARGVVSATRKEWDSIFKGF